MTGAAADIRLVPRPPARGRPRSTSVFGLAPGDRPLVAAGESVVVGAPIAERLRDPRLEEVHVPETLEPHPGSRWSGRPTGDAHRAEGELVFAWRGPLAGGRRRRSATRSRRRSPGSSARSGREPRSRSGPPVAGLRGIVALGGPTRGRLQGSPDSELRAGGLDVGSAGAILVVGSRVDAETLTRARAMGVRGVVVTGLSSKERRDFLASEARQRAALHRLPPFAVLVLDGAVRRPLAGAGPGRARRADRARGRDRHRPADARLRPPGPGRARRRRPTWSGSAADALAGREGRFVEAIGPRRFPGGVHLEAVPGPLPGRHDGGGPARRPRAVRLAALPTRPRRPDRTGTIAFGYARTGMPTSTALLERRLESPDPVATSALGLALAEAAGRATWSACGATSAPARRTSPRRSAPGSA